MMPLLSELHLVQWHSPWGGLVLLLPVVLGWLARRRHQRLTSYADAHLQAWALVGRQTPRRSLRRRLPELTAWVLLALAAAGPRIAASTPGAAEAPAASPHLVDVMVVLDVSASMAASDVAPDRLSRARLKLLDLLPRLRGESLGLILYAGEAGLLLPPTDDLAIFERALSHAGADVLNAPGTDVAQALRLAQQALQPTTASGTRQRGRAVLLITDAESSSLEGAAGEATREAVEELRAADISLQVLALASPDGAPIPLATGGLAMQDGKTAVSRPAARAYRQLAERTGGQLAMVTDGDADWKLLYDAGIGRLPGASMATGPAQAWRELFPLPLGLALALLLWVYMPPSARRPRSHVGMLLALCIGGALLPQAAKASDEQSTTAAHSGVPSAAAQAAAQAYRNSQWSQALPLFDRQGGYAGHMGAGAAAWKLRDDAAAARHFSNALLLARNDKERDDALYNLGNAQFGLGQWDSAAQAWRAVLLSRPGDANAAANLVHAEAQLAKRRGMVPMKSDLRGRRGFLSEGQVGVDGPVSKEMDESLRLPDTPQMPSTAAKPSANGARLAEGAGARDATPALLNPQRLQSGLVKLERLEDQNRTLLRGLLKQDRRPSTSPATGSVPW